MKEAHADRGERALYVDMVKEKSYKTRLQTRLGKLLVLFFMGLKKTPGQ